MMKIGVTGAFGFLGANVVAQALSQGRQVVAFASKTRSNPLFDPDLVEVR
ncbi:MAG: NAD-dependent epimerase/dehydratase family protein, partial [Spirochaetales bacterium]